MDFTMWVVLSRFFLLQRAASKILFKALLESGNALLKASNTERQLSFLPQVRLMTPLPKSIVTDRPRDFQVSEFSTAELSTFRMVHPAFAR